MKTALLFLSLLLFAACSSVPPLPLEPTTHRSVADIEAAIRAGKAGATVAERTNGFLKIDIEESTGRGFPYQVFTVRIDSSEYFTLLVEQENVVVTLCGGFGGGIAHDFAVRRRGGKTVIDFTVELGSGVQAGGRCHYIVGSGGDDAEKAAADHRHSEKRRPPNPPVQGTPGSVPSPTAEPEARRP